MPHFHATYGEYIGVYDMQTGDMIEGDMPKRAHRMCQEWANRYRTDLQFMWISQQFVQLPGLEEQMTDHYPKVRHVEPLLNRQLFVTFQDGTYKVYDCLPLLQQATFAALEDDALFRRVKVDDGGYGISWNDAIDLSEAELWQRGRQPTENEIIRGGIHAQNH